MKTNRYTISRSALPTTLPITDTLVAYLLLDRFHAPGWAWGVVITVLSIVWFGSIATILKSEERTPLGFGFFKGHHFGRSHQREKVTETIEEPIVKE